MDSTTRYTLRTFWRHAARYPWALIALLTGVITASAADVYAPLLYKDLFDVIGGQSGADPYRLVVLIAAVNGIAWAGWRLALFTLNWFEPRVMADLLATGFRYLLKHSYTFFNDNFAGSLVRRLGRYPDAFEDITDQIIFNFLQLFVRVGSILAVLSFRYWQLAVVVAVWAVAYSVTNYKFASYKLKFDAKRAEADSAVTGRLSDVISNTINLKLFGGEAQEERGFEELNRNLFKLRRFTWNLDQYSESIQAALMVALEFGTVWMALRLWQAGRITVGDFALLQSYLLLLFNTLWNLGRNLQRVFRSISDAQEMSQILTAEHGVRDAPGAGTLKVTDARIAFERVDFHYSPDKPVLKDFSFTVQPKEKVALIGPSGGGKSTIVKLLFRFLDIQGGTLSIDGQDIAEVTQESLRAAIALVPQDPTLFHRSLMDNIRYARPDATDDEVVAAAKQAHCHEFISRFPEGYATFVGERGVKLSGGERQRVAIARAILKDAPILVLDEATSALDSESERYIQDALRELMDRKTTIVIAHRLSTIMEMDRIVVLEGGRITEEGKHEELVKARQGTYQKLWEIQAGGFGG